MKLSRTIQRARRSSNSPFLSDVIRRQRRALGLRTDAGSIVKTQEFILMDLSPQQIGLLMSPLAHLESESAERTYQELEGASTNSSFMFESIKEITFEFDDQATFEVNNNSIVVTTQVGTKIVVTKNKIVVDDSEQMEFQNLGLCIPAQYLAGWINEMGYETLWDSARTLCEFYGLDPENF